MMQKEEFLTWVSNTEPFDPELITEEEAKAFLDGWETAPKDLDAAEFTAFYNDKILSMHQMVKDPVTGKYFPRWTYMDKREIASVIWEANTWGDVDDLVEYVLDAYIGDEWDEEIDPYAVEKRQEAILRWCEEQV